jgi:hypothetical protein
VALDIQTFSNRTGGFAFFKAVGHPAVATSARRLITEISQKDEILVYDPQGFADAFAQLHDLSALNISQVLVQNIDDIGNNILGRTARPITDFPGLQKAPPEKCALLCTAFDAGRLIDQIRHLLPDGMDVVTLDTMRLDDDRLTNTRRYLDPLNFATNFAFFRDIDGPDGDLHTRLFTANYWHGYGARGMKIWATLVDGDGEILCEWADSLPDTPAPIEIDSRDIRTRFGLGDFTGQLFLHVIGVRGHDVVKYALDTYGENDGHAAANLSCTHDANAWPSDLFAGLPAPREGEQVLLWIQNSHPCKIPGGAVGINRMGDNTIAPFDIEVPAFGTAALDVTALLPEAKWPEQLEVQAGKHFVRPRYEVVYQGGGTTRRRIAHVNVERDDLAHDPRIGEIGNLMGKGFILPAPILPPTQFKSYALPTPMATCQNRLPLTLLAYDSAGKEVARKMLGALARDHATAVDIDDILDGGLASGTDETPGFGHMEIVYDFDDSAQADGIDGWLHGLFRYENRQSGHAAETSFGAHMFNTALVYKNEPQSYAGAPPGLSTRLFLRLGNGIGGKDGTDTMCHLIYPASTPWHDTSTTALTLHDSQGTEVAVRNITIPCGGSHLWRYSETFNPDERAAANAKGDAAYVIIRDVTCRLFGYHGVIANNGAEFSFDHMFGF